MADATLRLGGFRDFARALKRLDLGDAVKDANRNVSQAVVSKAETEGRRLGGVHAHVVRMGSIRSSARTGTVSVILGGSAKKHGPALGAEFGAKRWRQFPAWKGNQEDAGYMVHEAIRRMKASGELIDLYEDAVFKALEPAFPD